MNHPSFVNCSFDYTAGTKRAGIIVESTSGIISASSAKNVKAYLEPSALAGFKGLDEVLAIDTDLHGIHTITTTQIKNGTHIVWSTGGNMVPDDIMKKYYENAK